MRLAPLAPLAALSALTLGLALPSLASAVTINFDDVSRPCVFSSAPVMTTEYSSQSITFSGGWEGLNQCGNFGVSGHSAPNFLAWNLGIGGQSATETLTFSQDANSIGFLIGTPQGGSASITAYDAAGTALQTVSRSLSGTVQSVNLTATGVRSLTITVPGGSYGVLDDLTYSLNAPPVADAGGPYSGGQGSAISLDGSGSSDSDGSVSNYEWDCTDDGTYDVSSASATANTCTYPDDGTYTVRLRVTDDDGSQATDTATVTVTNALPTANAGGPYTVNQGVALSLDGSASSDSDGTLSDYAWDCTSDGSYDVNDASATASTCTYADVGTYTITLQVTDDDGGTATATA
ncbi:MAG: PKD domain-containing protein, partial [Deltaproteobacteria bacterium]|nr:PKD domain-containing protein [Deltaproteobacteria bacterium]